MSQFKVGDKVRIKPSSYSNSYHMVGWIGTIVAITYYHKVKFANENWDRFYAYELELVEESFQEAATKIFKQIQSCKDTTGPLGFKESQYVKGLDFALDVLGYRVKETTVTTLELIQKGD